MNPDDSLNPDEILDVHLCRRYRDEPEPIERHERPIDTDWRELVAIVADVFRVRPGDLTFPCKKRLISTPRHVIAAIWSDAYTMDDTMTRLRWRSTATVSASRSKVERMLVDGGLEADRINEVMRRIAKRIPHIVGHYPCPL